MKINFNEESSISFKKFSYTPLPVWLQTLISAFYAAYDIDPSCMQINKFTTTLDGVNDFCDWLKESGYKATIWETKTKIGDSPFAFGINIADDCPLFVELKLKHIDFQYNERR